MCKQEMDKVDAGAILSHPIQFAAPNEAGLNKENVIKASDC